ncbi:Pycsar system effector family protein [Antribacter gilvus]|uniref:Pycsar system effector family protein n=1 Tax=Antribacter gilvus TaxID=2304675 RepID=UPI003B8379F3
MLGSKPGPNARRLRRRARQTTSAPDLEFAWRLHDGIGEWTARVDTKASISLAIEAAVLGFVVALASGDGVLSGARGWVALLLRIGIVALLLSTTLSVLVVFPQLRGRATRKEYPENVIYFGHLRHWDPVALENRLSTPVADLGQLSRQLVNMSRIVWRKHIWLQWSLALFVVGVALFGASLIVSEWQSGTYRSAIPYLFKMGEMWR